MTPTKATMKATAINDYVQSARYANRVLIEMKALGYEAERLNMQRHRRRLHMLDARRISRVAV